MHKSPFKFLDSYTKDDRHIFFGRDREIEELFQKVYESRLIIVYGVSGTGKTSLVNCGLANKIPDTDWLPLNVRRGRNIIESTARAISEQAVTPIESNIETPGQFKKSIRSLYLDHYKPLFFIFDQFEELFIFGSKDEKTAFVSLIKELVDSDLQCRFLFVMREEYLAAISEFEKHIPGFLSNRIRIEKMTPACAGEAIEGPCKAHDIKIDDGFAASLLEKLSHDSAEVELTYLQVFLDKVYRLAVDEARAGERLHFYSGLLKKAGNVSDLLGSFLDEQIDLLDDPDTALAVLKSFVSVKGTKRQMSVEEVTDYARTLGKPIQLPKLQELLQTLIQLRILRDKDQNNRYELRHDALATTIYEKITLVEKELLEIRHLIENAYNNWERRGVLLSPEDLAYIAAYESRIHLSKHLARFVEASKAEVKKKRLRRRNLVAAVVMALLLVMAGFTYWALGERSIARDNERKALAEKFNFLAKDLVQTDPTKALRVAEHALSLDPDNRSIYQNLLRIYYDNNFYRILFVEDDVTALDISPDGKYILTGSRNGIATLWDSEGNQLQIFSGHSDWVSSVVFSPDGNSILTGSGDKTARLWDLKGNQLKVFSGHQRSVSSAVFSPKGNHILTGSSDRTARLWDLEGNQLQVFSGHQYPVSSAVFSPDGNYILTGGLRDSTLRLWDLEGNQLLETSVPGLLYGVFSPNGNSILTGSRLSGNAKLLDLEGNQLHAFSGHLGFLNSAVFSADGLSVLTGSHDGTARLWDLEGNQLQIFLGQRTVESAVFFPHGRYILTKSDNRKIKEWKVNKEQLQVFSGHSGQVSSAVFSPDGKYVLTGSVDGTARLWDLEGNQLQVFSGHSRQVSSAVFSPGGKYVLTGSVDETARLWDLEGNQLQVFTGHSGSVSSAVFSPDGKYVLTGSSDETARLWDIEGNEKKVFFSPNEWERVSSAVFSPDGNYVLIVYSGQFGIPARLWDLEGNQLQDFSGHNGMVISAVFSPDGKFILTGSNDRTARLWDLKGNQRQVFSGHQGNVNAAVFSPDGEYILTCSSDRTARFWDLNGNQLQVFSDNKNINSVAFSPDGNSILAANMDGTATLWRIKQPYSEFAEEGLYEQLSIKDKIEFGILSFQDVMRLSDKDELSLAASYYFDAHTMLIYTEGLEYLDFAKKLTNKLIRIDGNNVKHNIRMLEILSLLDKSKAQGEQERHLATIRRNLSNFTDEDKIVLAEYFFSNANEQVEGDEAMEFYELSITLFESAIAGGQKSSETNLLNAYNNIAYEYLFAGKFSEALTYSRKGAELYPDSDIIMTKLVLSYLLNDAYDQAIEILLERKNNTVNQTLFGAYIVTQFHNLEEAGITHPDFDKVRELLDNS